jgi:hypothetical protein
MGLVSVEAVHPAIRYRRAEVKYAVLSPAELICRYVSRQ